MKKLTLIATLLVLTSYAKAADTYKFDSSHTSINWSANHFGFSSPSGKFTDIDGTLIIDENNLQNSSVEVTIRTSSIATGIAKFDEHLKSSDFFSIDKFPVGTFVSTSVSPVGKTAAKVRGNLTLLGVTKLVNLDVKLNKIGTNPVTQKKTAGFTATTIIKRSDFGINYGLPGISDNIKISIEAEAILNSSNSSSGINGSKGNDKNTEAGSWKIINDKSKLEFKASQGSSVISGSFKNFNGTINFDPKLLATSKVNIEIDTGSIQTPFTEASDVVKTASWLATSTFPKANFTAEKFTFFGGKKYHADGLLTIKGKSIPTSLEFSLDEYSKTTAKVTGSTTIKRTDFNIGDKDPKKANNVADKIEITFTISVQK